MKKYFKDNKKLFKFINNKKYNILKIKPVRKIIKCGFRYDTFISSYCVIYEKMI
jgi:hypothetical protein